jgi:ABC-2 type transport system ATP-binding protein
MIAIPMNARPGAEAPGLHVSGLRKRYGDIEAVRNLSFDVRPGEVFGFLGPNGAGKSTTIHMVCGLLKPDAGEITLDGSPVTPSARDVRSRIGVCPQDYALWNRLTCFEQLRFMGVMYGMKNRLAGSRAETLLRDLGLRDQRNRVAGSLSGGMKRRLNLILALVHDPDLVILDEPEAGLDPQSRVLVRETIRGLARTKTVIFTTHNMDEAERVCDRVAIIDRGTLLRCDTPAHLKESAGTGPVLEIFAPGPSIPEAMLDALRQMHLTCSIASETVRIQGKEAVRRLHEVLDVFSRSGVSVEHCSVRENTLEDVFIALTGRRLRE